MPGEQTQQANGKGGVLGENDQGRFFTAGEQILVWLLQEEALICYQLQKKGCSHCPGGESTKNPSAEQSWYPKLGMEAEMPARAMETDHFVLSRKDRQNQAAKLLQLNNWEKCTWNAPGNYQQSIRMAGSQKQGCLLLRAPAALSSALHYPGRLGSF